MTVRHRDRREPVDPREHCEPFTFGPSTRHHAQRDTFRRGLPAAEDPELFGADSVDGLAEDFSGRLTALSNVHSVVFNAGGDEAQLNDIIDATVAPYRVEGRVSRVRPRW